MKKLTKGRLLSGALATALTVANMGALMPMTVFAADPQKSTVPNILTAASKWDISFKKIDDQFYDKDEQNKEVTFVFGDDLKAKDPNVSKGAEWSVEVKSGDIAFDSGATTVLKSNDWVTDTADTIGGKLDLSAMTTPGETTTFALMYDQDGATGKDYLPVEVSTIDYTFKTKAIASQLKGVVTIEGADAVYSGNSTDLTLNIGDVPDGYFVDADTKYIMGIASGSEIKSTALTLSGDYGTSASTYGENKKGAVAIDDLAAEGQAKIGVWVDTVGSDADALDIKEINVTKSAITDISATGTGKYLGVYDTDVTSDGITVEATETYNDPKGGAQIKWAVVKNYGSTDASAVAANATDDFTIKVNDGSDSTTKATKTPFTGTSFTDTAVINAGSGLNEESDAGKYTVVAYTGAENAKTATTFADPVATYDFEVVDVTKPAIIKDTDTNTSSRLYVGKSVELGLYAGKNLKKISNATFTLDDKKDADYVTIEGNKVTVNKVKTTSSGAIKINASYDIADGVSYKTPTSGQYTLTTIANGFTIETGKNAVKGKDLNANGELEIGNTTTVVAKFAGNEVKGADGVEWSSSDEKIVKVDNDGNVTGVGAGTAKLTATYTDENNVVYGSEPAFLTIKVAPVTCYLVDEDGYSVGTSDSVDILIGDSKTYSLATSNGSDISNLTWTSNNENITVTDGTITVQDGAKSGEKATIKALVSGSDVATITVTAKDVIYSAVDEDGDIVTAPSLFKGESITLNALRNGEAVDGEWKLVTSVGATTGLTNESISLSGNVVTATKSADDNKNGVAFFASTNKTTTPDLAFVVTVNANVYELYIDEVKKNADSGTWAASTYALAITDMEVGESHTFRFMNGAEDVTTKGTTYKYDEEIFSIDNGVLTVIGEGTGATITIENKTGSTTNAKGVITVGKIYAGNGAAEKATTAISSAKSAGLAASDAIDSAAAATEAAEAAKADPTAENLSKAEDALDEAKEALDSANKALKVAQDALAEAEAAGAKSESAVAAVEAAEAAVEQAEKDVADAEAAVADAQTAFDEAASEVEKAKKAEEEKKEEEKKQQEEQKAAEEKAAAQKEGATGTDATANANFTVTSTADKTVAYTAPATKAKKVTIPSTVTVGGDPFAVTEIAANAFKNDKTVTTITIPASIKKINSNAFKNAKNLKKINVKGAKLTTVKKNAFNGIKKNATIKVTGANKKANKKLLKKTTAVKKGNVKVK
ncbi:leucine-rich repeat protein [Butyrivibrio sp. NC2002]|uniref:leucine-rich repeat protein n=1 Tax=Butyrivibrio sp. NC2002 TaxID=1410610 RepID=UPI00068EBF26|nr:leucine-rich repeat protein [Butyrivibrio sp. NC2002]